jgi:hypothetical protein
MALIDNQVAYWKLDESSGNAADSTANAYTFTNVSTVGYAAGKVNNGASFGSSNASKYFSRSDALGMTVNGSTVMSVSAWVNFSSPFGDSDITSIFSIRSANLLLMFNVRGNAGGTAGASMEVYGFGAAGGSVCSAAQTFNTGQWYHLVWVLNNTTYALYVNGSQVGTGSTTFPSSTTGLVANTYLGYAAGFGVHLSGYADEVGVWSRAITSDEVTSLYNAGSGFQYPYTPLSTGTAGRCGALQLMGVM